MKLLRIFDSSFPRKIAAILTAALAVAATQYSQTRRPPRVITTLTDVVNAMQFSPDGHMLALRFGPGDQTLAFALTDGTVSVWDTRKGALSFELKKAKGAVNAIAFSRDGTLMATGGDDRTATIWEVASGKARRVLKGHDLAITSLAFSPDGTMLAVGSGNASVVLWQVAGGKLDRVLK